MNAPPKYISLTLTLTLTYLCGCVDALHLDSVAGDKRLFILDLLICVPVDLCLLGFLLLGVLGLFLGVLSSFGSLALEGRQAYFPL